MKISKTLNTIGIILLMITSLNALAAGFSMIVEPSGKDLGMSVESVLKYSPFNNFLIPGITLFSTIGLFCIFTVVAVFRKWKNYELVILFQVLIITGWIFFQVIFLREFNWLHAIIGSIGLYVIFWGLSLYKRNRITA